MRGIKRVLLNIIAEVFVFCSIRLMKASSTGINIVVSGSHLFLLEKQKMHEYICEVSNSRYAFLFSYQSVFIINVVKNEFGSGEKERTRKKTYPVKDNVGIDTTKIQHQSQ